MDHCKVVGTLLTCKLARRESSRFDLKAIYSSNEGPRLQVDCVREVTQMMT